MKKGRRMSECCIVNLSIDYFDSLLSINDFVCETAKDNNHYIAINSLEVQNTLENTVESAFRVTHLPTKTMVHCDYSDDVIENVHRALSAMRDALHKLRYGVLKPNRSDKRKAEKLDRLKRKKGQ